MAIVSQISPILHAAFKHHVAQFYFLPRTDLKLKKLVATFFEVHTRHNDQIDGLAQLNQVLLCEILYLLLYRIL
jgi:hypothetical protein